MSTVIDPTNKSSFLYSDSVSRRIIDICTPLDNYLGIKAFGYIKIYDDCSYLLLVNRNTEFVKDYYEDIFTQDPKVIKKLQETSFGESFYMNFPKYLTSDPVMSIIYRHGYWNGFMIYKKNKNYYETYCFTFERDSDDKIDFFKKNIFALYEFTNYFNATANDLIDCTDKSKLAIFKKRFNWIGELSNQEINEKQKYFNAIHLNSSFNNHLPQKLHPKCILKTNSGIIIKFSQREIDCIKLLAHGKTMKEVGRFLNLSPRTVESYIERAKNKVGCNYKSQLFDIVLSNNINLYT